MSDSVQKRTEELYVLKMQIAGIRQQKSLIVDQKNANALELSEVKSKISEGNLTDRAYRDILRRQHTARTKNLELETSLSKINNELRFAHAKEDTLRVLCYGTGEQTKAPQEKVPDRQLQIIDVIRALQVSSGVAKDLADLLRQINAVLDTRQS